MPRQIDPTKLSMAERLALLPLEERRALLNEILEGASTESIRDLEQSWEFWARPTQIAPGPGCECGCDGKWLNWVIIAGRGWGKTRTGAEWVQQNVNDGTYGRYHLVGATASDIRDIMIEGPSGILATAKPENTARYSPTKRKVTWDNGAVALCFSADEPERLRGEQCEAAWADELAAWRYPDAWKQLALGLRLGPFPRTIITTTPRATPLIKKLIGDPRNHVTRGTTYDNIANLAEAFINEITRDMDGTRFGRQEIYAEILDDSEMAFWNRELLENCRVGKEIKPTLKKVVIGVDVAVSFGEESAETGIVVCGLAMDGTAYVLQDASGKLRPDGWAKKVSALYHEWSKESPEVRVVAEKNMGYDLISHTIQVEDSTVPVKLVHASKNKLTRAEPVATAYERGKVKHIGFFDVLEEQMCTYEAGDVKSPDRMDALVWALTELVVGRQLVISTSMIDNPLSLEESYWHAI